MVAAAKCRPAAIPPGHPTLAPLPAKGNSAVCRIVNLPDHIANQRLRVDFARLKDAGVKLEDKYFQPQIRSALVQYGNLGIYFPTTFASSLLMSSN